MVAGRRVDRQRMAPEGVERRFAPVEGSKTLLPSSSPGCRGGWPPRLLWAQETAGSTPASQTLKTERGRGEAVPASLMSLRPWVRIPPAQLVVFGGVAQLRRALACQARGRR